jgi:uncharacterized Zn finger protein (UPF0148 family)
MRSDLPEINAWQPPDNYQEVESMLEGISVFAPVKKPDRPEDPKTFHCPQCGAVTGFNVSAGGVACEHCGFVAGGPAAKIGRMAQEYEFKLETLKAAENGWGAEWQELHCDSCGAELVLSEGALSTTCPFCASNKVNVQTAKNDTIRPRYVIPFKVQPKGTHTRAEAWLGKGWFHPGELSARSIIDRFVGIYLSFWTFDANIDAHWRAEVGYEKQERYFDNGEWKTRTRIEWRWESGNVSVIIDDMVISGNSHVSRHILEQLYPFDLDALVAYKPDYLAGWQAQAYDLNLPDAWDEAKNRMREQGKDACRENIHSSHVRNFSMKADFSEETWRYILLPVYLAAYKFEENIYQVMVNGQTGVVAGQKPVAWSKIWLAVAGLLSPGILLGLAGLPLLLIGGVGLVPLILGFVLLVIGIILSVQLYKKAVASEAS